ncbi:hypothetical protein Pfo_005089 [Paulownia fortunei]|nr:hypothetical protein Pfo_005089 [Paulownia fortunei]
MPLSEFLRLAVEKLESGQKKQCSTDLSSRTENDLVELVWEDDQIMMQGQSSRVTRNPTLHSLPNTPRVRDAAEGNSTTARIGKFGGVESILNYISPVVPLGHLDLSQNDEMVPWLSYPVNDGLQDYCSELLPEISGVTANGMSARNSFVSGDKGGSCDQEVSNLDNDRDAFKFSSSKARPLCSWPPQQGQTSDPSLGSGVSNIISNNTSNSQDAIFGNCAQGREVVNDSANMKMERQNITLPSNNSSLLNFSHFSRPAILVKAKLPNSGGIPPVSLGVERMEVKERGSASRSSNIVKSLLIERLNSTEKDIDFHVPSAPTMVKSGQLVNKQSKVSFLAEGNENLCQEASMKNAKALIQSNTANSTKGVPDGDRGVEPMVASSSVGSGNSADRASYEQTHNSKRKFHDIEESECHSDDIETESFGVKKPTPARGVTGSKRSRAAEVHNLSERRRRDRINEKMRALQELIPNCNKIDKASMLDEAIEYLKNLQLQVQMMSMGAGLCMPPMMFPRELNICILHMYLIFHPWVLEWAWAWVLGWVC